MDPITLALTAALRNLDQPVIKSEYDALKAALQYKFGAKSKLLGAIDKLEQDLGSRTRQTVLHEEVESSGADHDPELLQDAEALIEDLKKLPGGQLNITQDIEITEDRNIVTEPGNVIVEETKARQKIYTGGGTYVDANVATDGGDFVGRDKVMHGDEVGGDKVQGDKVGGVSIGITSGGIGGSMIAGGNISINPLPPAEILTRKDLTILLENVETTWIRGVLEKSTHHAVLLDLGIETRADAVDHPWHMVLEGPDQMREALPPEKKIKEIYEEANHLLLILGEPGSGKTTTLLQLARDLLVEVDQEFTQPVPVILNLSTWADKQQPLDDWLVRELNGRYFLPQKDGRRYLEERRILPLLDGLDEVKVENRAACVKEINRLAREYGLQGLVVCSRIKDYTALDVRLAFYGAIYLQPLTPEQIDQYFDRASDQLASLRTTLQRDEALQSLARTPLMLNIMSLTYKATSAEDLISPALDTDEARRRYLFDTYIIRMFKRRVSGRSYDDEQTRQRLSWLARNMQQHNQDVFLIEGLQPSWLSARRWQWVYILASRLAAGLSIGLLFGLSVLIFDLTRGLTDGLTDEPLWGLLFGLSVGLPVGLIDLLRLGISRFRWFAKRIKTRSSDPFWWSVTKIVVVWLSVGLLTGSLSRLSSGLLGSLIFFGLLGGLMLMLRVKLPVGLIDASLFRWLRRRTGRKKSPPFWWSVINVMILWLAIELAVGWAFEKLGRLSLEEALIVGLIAGPILGLIFGLRGSRQSLGNDIQTVEALSWSWRRGLVGVLIGVLTGVLIGMLISLIGVLIIPDSVLVWLFIGPLLLGLLSLIGALVGAIFYGLSREIVETKTTPNQGIRLSIRNAITVGLAIGLGFGTLSLWTLSRWLGAGLTELRSASILVAWFVGLAAVLWYGGLDIIQHYALRLILVIQGHMPGNYARFLDNAADHIFLQKVGGGYRFIHRLLLEHFAAISETRK